MRFCPKCGVEIESGTFCSNCKNNKIIELNKNLMKNLLVCEECYKIRFRNSWKNSENLSKDISNLIKDELKKQFDLKQVKINVKIEDGIEERLEYAKNKINETAKISLKKNDLVEEHNLNFTIVKEVCSNCSKKNTEYFEGILQIRNPDEDILEFLNHELYRAEEKLIFVTNVEKVKNGFDYYITSKKHITRIAQSLQSQFGGTVKVSEQLFSHDSLRSKDIFRINVLYNCPDTKKGDVIKYNDKIYLVTSVTKQIYVKELDSETKSKISFDDSFEKIKSKKTLVIKEYPEYEAMGPDTYESLLLVTDKKLVVGQKIKVVQYNGKLYQIR
jgi:nonsense-mediated mRNA decay protein 3